MRDPLPTPDEAKMSATLFDRLCDKLQQQAIDFEVMRHPPVFTSEEAARVRGTDLASGAKALVCKADGNMVMFVLPADQRLASRQVRRQCGIKSLRFASRDEVLALTGLAPGSIPPFGSLFGLPTFCDERLTQQDSINFNAGDHAISLSMRCEDYLAVEQPEIGDFAE